MLRTATDIAFEGKAESYLTVLPLPKLGYQAFVRTWAAEKWLRSGSVWSHVLLVDFVSLGKLSDPQSIEQAFRRPKTAREEDFDKEVSKYEKRRILSSSPADRGHPIDRAFALPAISDIYSTDKTVVIGGEGSSSIDGTMLAIHLQQWPRLRRSFSYRTRYRTSESPWKLDLEVVERGASPTRPHASDSPWVSDLLVDLERPDHALRSYLQRYGSESKAGRGDMRTLIELYEGIQGGRRSPYDVVELLKVAYPSPAEMQTLKRDLFGPSERARFRFWAHDEYERLALALRAGTSVDYADLAIGKRFASVALGGDPTSLRSIGSFELGAIPPDQVEVLVADLATDASVEAALTIADAHPDLGLLMASRRPDLLAVPAMWTKIDGELLLDVLDSNSESAQTGVLLALVAAGGSDAIAYICGRDPSRWWALLLDIANRTKSAQDLQRASETLRASLDRVGAAGLNSPARVPESAAELILTLLSANLSAGLWRRVQASQWVNVAKSLGSRPLTRELPKYAKDRIFAVALLTATSNPAPSVRSDGWRAAFPYLHEALKRDDFDGEAWAVLSNALPTGVDWDRCARLRSGAIAEIHRDSWSSVDVQALTSAAGPFGAEIVANLNAAKERQQKRGLLYDFLSLFR